MQEFFEKNKQMVIIGTVVIVVLVIGGILLSSGKKAETKPGIANEEPTEAPIPTVDASVKVEFNLKDNNRRVDVIVSNTPSGTKTLDIEMSYPTAENLEGTYQEKVPLVNGVAKHEFVFGTESSNVYRYHVVTGDPKLVIKFNGSYGEKIFEKSYKMK